MKGTVVRSNSNVPVRTYIHIDLYIMPDPILACILTVDM